MDQRRTDERLDVTETPDAVVVRRFRWGRVAGLIALGLLVLLAIAIAIIWIERQPIATHYIKRELERRGVQGSYHLDKVGFRTQQVSNLVIGDPKHPDLVARFARIQTRLKLDGSFEVYRIVARGVRLRGRLVHGRISWGQIDKLLPPPSNKPFALPNFALDVADSSIALATPFGPVGVALQGNGQLSGGFKGHASVTSPKLIPGKCAATDLHAYLNLAVVARHPRVEGPVTLASFNCPASRFLVDAPRFDAKASFNESFTKVDGSGRMAISTLTAGANGLAAFVGSLTYEGPLSDVRGRVKLAAQKSRLGTIYADRTRLDGAYRLGIQAGTFTMLGGFAADSSTLDPSMLAGVIQPLKAAKGTPIGPVATSIGNALSRTARRFNIGGHITLVNFPGGGAARITDANIVGPNGARANISGGSGVTYYWPAQALRIDGTIAMNGGGGLPNGRVTLSQPGPGAPLSGVADIAPYAAGGQRLALSTIRFGPGPGGSTALSTVALLDGSFPGGRVKALRLPISGRLGPGSKFAFGTACEVISFDYFQMSTVQFGRSRLPVCPIGPAIILKRPSGPVLVNARVNSPVLDGRIGKSLLHLAAASGRLTNSQFAFDDVGMRLGRASPVIFDASSLTGSFAGSNLSGKFAGAKATVGNVPLLLSDATGSWSFRSSNLAVDSALILSDRDAEPRFYPLKTDDMHMTIAGDYVRATGSLHHPDTGTLVTDVSIEHQLSTGAGHALLDVPGLTFGPDLQPAELTRLTEGVIALVNGPIRGQGRIDWNPEGEVTSTGDFSTANLDLAAPFGPVEGMSGTIHFNDLLGLNTPPGQTLTLKSVNPGILVENGVLHYQLLPSQLVKIERGEWPFMGGRLILNETVLNFARPTAKRLTFEVAGLDASTFVQSLGFGGLEARGTFDGVLPMIFDESGGRIVGGRLDSRAPGGSLAYNGGLDKADLGTMGNIAFNALRDLRFRSMIIRLDGDLAGEFTSRLAIDGVALGQSTQTQRIIRSLLAKVPIKLNVTISGPFRSLIHMTKSFNDPREMIGDVLPRPLEDIPGITTEVRRLDEDQQQTEPPVTEPAATATPPTPTER